MTGICPFCGNRLTSVARSAVTDLDNDGLLDLLVGSDDGYVQHLRAAGPAARHRQLHAHEWPGVYYRLRQVESDGTASHSPVRTVQVGGPATLSLFLNPTRGTAALTVLHRARWCACSMRWAGEVLAATADAAGTVVLALPAGHTTGVYVGRVASSKALRLTVE